MALTRACLDALLRMSVYGPARRSKGTTWNIGDHCYQDSTIDALVQIGFARYGDASAWRGGVQIPATAEIATVS